MYFFTMNPNLKKKQNKTLCFFLGGGGEGGGGEDRVSDFFTKNLNQTRKLCL